MYTYYVRLACVSSVMALTSLAATAYAVGPGDEPGEAAHSAIVIHERTFPALSQEDQETLRDLVAQKDDLWNNIHQEGGEGAYQTFMRGTFKSTTEPMVAYLKKQYEQSQADYRMTFDKAVALSKNHVYPAYQAWEKENPDASSAEGERKMNALKDKYTAKNMQRLRDIEKQGDTIGNQLSALMALQLRPIR
ncbi:hypothetical protein [Candidatus Hepatobacter penaei]|uniref:hypothetical protein n=1 Tax=Candidatus Hepatobacter penaei TaxID=1274402 RepID=UPI0004F27348|nr:hypothetical protein [Candidatus Hepatobacter penaei]